MRIFLAALSHETNTFSPLPTTLRAFVEEGIFHCGGDASTLASALQFHAYGHLVGLAQELGHEVVTGLCAWAQPAGPAPRRDYENLRNALLGELAAAGNVDAVFLVLHGAMVADGYPDAEGDVLTKVRDAVGPAVPIGALLDLHGNVSRAMIDSGAVLMACKEYPHTDYQPRTRELLAILVAAASGLARPRTLMQRVPMLGLYGTTDEPMRGFVRRLHDCEGHDGILSVSAMHGFAWSDTPDTGASILVVHEPDVRTHAAALAADLGDSLFQLRHGAASKRLSVTEALDAAFDSTGLVVLADVADNAGGGAASDSTFLLRALIDRNARDVALGVIWDPQATAIAADAGVGATVPLRIGGKVSPMSGLPVDVLAQVMAVRSDASQRGLNPDVREPLGLAASLRVGGIDIVINSLRQQVFSPDCFTELGIDLSSKRLVVVKSTQHFRAAFDAIASKTLYCDAPGSLNADLGVLPYRHLARPIWPLDPL